MDHLQNSTATWGSACLALLLAAVINGCGGGQSGQGTAKLSKEVIEARQKAWQADYDAENPPSQRPPKMGIPTKNPVLAEKPPRPPITPVAASDSDKSSGPTKPSRQPIYPEKVADWKPDDFLRARKDGESRLVEAVVHLSQHTKGVEEHAPLLAGLLAPADTTSSGLPQDNRQSQLAPAGNAKLLQAVVVALVANGTLEARRTLEGLITGDFAAANRPVAVAAVLDGLMAQGGSESEDLLFQFIVNDDKKASLTQAGADLTTLRRAAVPKIAAAASESLRVRLARHMVANELARPVRDQLRTCFNEPQPVNLVPQIILYCGGDADAAARQLAEKRFAAQDAVILSRLMGIRPSLDAARDGETPTDGTASCHVAADLWGGDLAAEVARRLSATTSLKDAASLVRLAGTMPCQTVRRPLLQTLERHWSEGPGAIAYFSQGDSAAFEPGLIAVTKTLLDRDSTSLRPSFTPPRRVGNESTATNAKMDEKRRIQELSKQWLDFSRKLSDTLCRRLREAARPGAEREGNVLPCGLHPQANVVASFRIEWPRDLGDKLAAVSYLRVGYVRTEQRIEPRRALAYYRRKLPDRKEHPIPSGLWLDSVVHDREKNRVGSTDVFLTAATMAPNSQGMPDREVFLVVEVLSVECDAIDGLSHKNLDLK